MALQLDVVRFFQNLPKVPLAEICKYLEDTDLIKLSVLSSQFQNAIAPQKLYGIMAKLSVDLEKSEIQINLTYMAFDRTKIKLPETLIIKFYTSEKEKMKIDETGLKISIFRKLIDNREILSISEAICSKFYIYFDRLESKNSMWMTRKDLLGVNCAWKHFGANLFSVEDFNALLHSWIKGEQDKVQHYSFEVEENLDMEEVLKGLETHKWDPERRDRKFMSYNANAVIQPLIDLAHGFDILGPRLATVALIQNTLHFVTWISSKRLEWTKWFLYNEVVFCNRQLQYATTEKNKDYYLKLKKDYLTSLRNVREEPELQLDTLQFLEEAE